MAAQVHYGTHEIPGLLEKGRQSMFSAGSIMFLK